MKNTHLLSYPYSGSLRTINHWNLCCCYCEDKQAGTVIWDRVTKLYIFQAHPMLGLSVSKVRFRNISDLKTYIIRIGVDHLKSC